MSHASRFWMVALGAGALSAAMCLLAVRGNMGGGPLLYFVQLPLFIVGLSFGTAAIAVAATTVAGIVFWARELQVAVVFSLVFVVPVVILVRQALLSRQDAHGRTEWYPPGLLAGWLVGIGGALLVAAGAWMAMQGGVELIAKQIAAQMFDHLSRVARLPSADPEARTRFVENLGGVLLGAMVAVLMMVTAVNGALAQGLVQRFGWNCRPAPRMAELDLPRAVPALFMACVIAGTFLGGDFGYMVRNAVPVLLVGGVLAGLAVAHAAVNRLEGRSWMLVIVYAICAFMMLPMFLLATIGLAEPFLNLRRRMAAA